MRFLVIIKPSLLLLASLIGVVLGGRQVYIFLSEKQPTAFTAENFAAQYNGQQWIKVTGHLAVDAHAQMPNHGNARLANLFVPLVPAGWQRAQPVHVVVAPQLVPAGGVNAWKAGIDPEREVTVTGMVRPLGGLNYGYVFPRLKFESPTVTINEDAHPQPPVLMGVFMGICLLLAALAVWRIMLALRA